MAENDNRNLLHDLVLSLHGGVLQILGVRSRADELLILTALLLAAGLAQFACSVDLMS